MSHKAQVRFIKQVKKLYPDYFCGTLVVDIGSLCVNGNNRQFFENCLYTGVDIIAGKNVDVVEVGHSYLAKRRNEHDVVVTCECLEHDKHYKLTLISMYHSLKEGGLLIITAAGEGRPEHGTSNYHPNASPATNDYYQNITNRMFQEVLNPSMFHTYYLSQRPDTQDIQFYGIKGNLQLYPSPIPIMRRIEGLFDAYSATIVEKKKEPGFRFFKSRWQAFYQSALKHI
jgi:hypothetical protein